MLTPPDAAYWRDNPLAAMIRACDVRCSNLEMVLSGDRAFASTFCGGQWLTTTEDRLDLLRAFGFDYYNTANNHTMDFSYEGMRLTNAALDRRGILHTGSGDSLAQASAPAFMDAPGGRVAFVSCTASCDDAARAGNPSRNIPARPGVSMLRHAQRLQVTPECLAVLDAVAAETAINARFLKSVKMGTHNLAPEIHRFGRLECVAGDENKKVTSCHKGDLKRILDAVAQAREAAEIVAVNIHSHDIRGETDDTADDYHEEFARACIDAGATAVVGTGTHQLKGVEVYRGRPIFYSLGNFMFKEEIMEFAPSDIFERYRVGIDTAPEALYDIRTKNGTTGLCLDPYNYRSVVPVLEFDEHRALAGVALTPVELNFDADERLKGFPRLAPEAVAQEIFERLRRLSAPYGTRLEMDAQAPYNIRVIL